MKKVYIVMETIRKLMPDQKYEEIVDINIISVCKTKKDAENVLKEHNPFTTKIKEGYLEG